MSQGAGPRRVLGEEQFQSLLGRAQTPRGVEPGPESEPDMGRAVGESQPGHVHQRPHPGPAGVFQLQEPAFHKNPVLFPDRHEIGHGAQGDQIQEVAQVEPRERLALEQRMSRLEDNAHAAKMMKLRAELGVHHGDTIRQGVLALVVIKNHDLDAVRAQRGNLGDRGRAAIHRDQKLRLQGAHTTPHPFDAQPVALLDPGRQKTFHRGPIRPQNPGEQRDRRHAVHVVIPVEHDALTPGDGGANAFDGGPHVWQEEWIPERLELGIQKQGGFLGRLKPAAPEQFGDERRHVELLGQGARFGRRVVGKNPARQRGVHGWFGPVL